jgi:hypothetical protein
MLFVSTVGDVFAETFDRIRDGVRETVHGRSEHELRWRPDPDANPIGWLVWHLTRIEDDHVAGVAGTEQVWTAGWAERFDLPYDRMAHGYGQSSQEVGEFRASADLLLGYHDAVHEQTTRYLRALEDADLDRVIDDSYDPPVTLQVRLVSVIADCLQHVGQAAYVLGLSERSGPAR